MSHRSPLDLAHGMTHRTRRLRSHLPARHILPSLRRLVPVLLPLALTAVAHAQGTMDFSGAQTLMGTFKSKQLWNPNPQLNRASWGHVSVYRWTGEDGYHWREGLVLPPSYIPGHRYPLVIQTHGFREGLYLVDGPIRPPSPRKRSRRVAWSSCKWRTDWTGTAYLPTRRQSLLPRAASRRSRGSLRRV